ncbi:MAG: hypothetical protein WBC33_10790 [Conexibacter sp.]
MGDIESGWRLVQLAELLRTLAQHEEVALAALHDVRGDIATGVVIDRHAIEDARAAAVEIAQLAERAEQLAELLAGEHDLELVPTVIASAAAHELAAGILDAGRARLAFQTLQVQDGWPALADALRSTDAHTAWAEMTIAEALGSFRGASPELVLGTAAAAGLAPSQTIVSCSPSEIAELAACLEAHAAGP